MIINSFSLTGCLHGHKELRGGIGGGWEGGVQRGRMEDMAVGGER